jgi:phosphate transport system protein
MQVEPTRHVFHEQLDAVCDRIAAMAKLVETAVEDSTTALLSSDARLAEQVITADLEIDRMKIQLEEQIFEQLALQQPVASDLRLLVGTLRMSADLERMGDLAGHVAKITRLRYPERAIPDAVKDTIAEMGSIARQMVRTTSEIVCTRDVRAAEQLIGEDDRMDELRRSLFRRMLGPEWTHGVGAAVDLALLGRYYERIADHAVSMAQSVIYLVTGAKSR